MKNQNLLFSIVIFAVTYLIYFITTAPGLTFTDSGELAAVCTTLGIAHPTGYPLFTLLGHLWTYLPFSNSEVYLLNLFAGFLTSLSSVVFYNLIVLLLTYYNVSQNKKNNKQISTKKAKQEIPKEQELDDYSIMILALALSFLYAFAGTIWAQAVAIEVYSLHLLLLNLILYFFLRATISENSKPYYIITALLLGLSFANHMTTVLLLPMIFFMYFKRTSDKFDFSAGNIKFLLFLIVPFLIGLSVYLYLPLRASAMPDFNWGYVSRNFEKFWYHFSGRQYQVWMFSGADVMKDNILRFFSSLPAQFAWIGLLFFIYGIYATLKKSKTLLTGLLLLIVTCVAYAINYSIHDIDSYFVTAYIGMFIITAFGVMSLIKLNKNILYATFLLPLIALAINYSTNDRSKDNLVPEYTKLVFESLEPNAVILSSQWDFWLSAAWYLQKVDGVRKDITIIDKELLRRTWYIEQLRKWYPEKMESCKAAIDDYLIDLELFESDLPYSTESIQRKFITMLNCFVNSNYGKSPVYMTLDVIESEPDAVKDFEKIATGFAFKLSKDKEPIKINVDKFDISALKESLNNNSGYLVDGVKELTCINFVNIGRYALMTGDKEQARIAFEKGLLIDPKSSYVREAINYFNNTKFE